MLSTVLLLCVVAATSASNLKTAALRASVRQTEVSEDHVKKVLLADLGSPSLLQLEQASSTHETQEINLVVGGGNAALLKQNTQEHLRSQHVKILKAAPAATTMNAISQVTDADQHGKEPLVNEPLAKKPLANESLANEPLTNEPLVFGYPVHLRQVLNDHASGKRVLNLPDENTEKKTSTLSKKLIEDGTFLNMPNNEENNTNMPLEHIDHIISTLDTFHAHREDKDSTYGTSPSKLSFDGQDVEVDKIKNKKKNEVSLTLLNEDEKEDANVTDLKYARHLDRTRTLTAQQHNLIHDVGVYGQAERKAKEIAALLETSDVQEHAHNMNSATKTVTNTIDILNNFLEEAQMGSLGKSNMDSQEDRRSTLTEEEEKIKQQEQDKTDSGISADMRLGNIVIDKSKANSFLEQKVGGYYKCSWGSTVCGRKRVCLAWGSWSEEGEEVHEEEYYLNGEETREGIFNKDAKCNTGFYARGSDGKPCGQCQSGRYQDQITRSRSCKACSAGKFTGTTCQTSCQQCEPGRFNARTGQSTCANCPSSKYTGQSGQTSCTSCPTGKFHGSFGQTSVTSCVGVESLPYTWAVDFDGECNGHNYWKFGNGQARNEGRNLEERAQAVGLICSLNPNTAAL